MIIHFLRNNNPPNDSSFGLGYLILLTKHRDRDRKRDRKEKKLHRKHSFAVICLSNFMAEIDNETEKCFSQPFAWKLGTKPMRNTTDALESQWCCLQFNDTTLLRPFK